MKLFKYGISGKFMTLVKSIYEQVKSCVKSRSGLTYFFKYKRGVRQGCLLSPVLFSLFLNDLQGYLLEGGANGITLWDITRTSDYQCHCGYHGVTSVTIVSKFLPLFCHSLGAVFYRGSKFQFCYLPLLEKV